MTLLPGKIKKVPAEGLKEYEKGWQLIAVCGPWGAGGKGAGEARFAGAKAAVVQRRKVDADRLLPILFSSPSVWRENSFLPRKWPEN